MKKLLFLLLALTVSAPAFAQTQTQYYTVPTIAALKAMTTSRPAVVQVVDANPGIFNLSSGACSAADDVFQVQPTSGTTVCYTRAATPYSVGKSATVNGVLVTGGTGVPSVSTTLPNMNIGTPTAGVGTNITGTAAGLTAGNVTTNANLTGDVTSVGNATTLATVNSNVGSFGSATQVGTFTVNAKGLLTAAGNSTVTPAVGSITGLGTGVATALGVNVGTAGALVVNGGALGTPSSGDTSATTVIATGTSTARSLATRFATTYNVRDFGALGDGSTDDVAAFNAAFTACEAATYGCEIEIPSGAFVLGSKIIKSMTKAVSIRGQGRGTTTLLWTAADGGFALTYNSQYLAPKISDLSIWTTSTSGGGTAISITMSPAAATANDIGPEIHSVDIRGSATATDYWTNGVTLTDVWYPVLSNFTIKGKDESVLPFSMTSGITITRTQVLFAHDFTMQHIEDGVLQAGTTLGEGTNLTRFEMVGVRRGVNLTSWAAGAYAIQGVQNGHINSYEYGIKTNYVVQANYSGLLLFKTHISTSNYVAIDLTNSSNARVVGNHMEDSPTATGTYTAVVLTTSSDNVVSDNTFDYVAAASTAINISTSSAGNSVTGNTSGNRGLAGINTVVIAAGAGAGNSVRGNLSSGASGLVNNNTAVQYISGNYPTSGATIDLTYASANSLQISSVLRNDNAGSPTTALGFNVAAAAAGDTSVSKGGIGFTRNNVQGQGYGSLYNQGTGAATDFTTADEILRWTATGVSITGTTTVTGAITSNAAMNVNVPAATLARLSLINTTRNWSISGYGTDVSPNGAFSIGDETGGSVRFQITTAGLTTVNGVFNLTTGNTYQINGTNVLSATTLGSGVTASSLTSVGTITTGTWNAGTVTSSGIISAAAASGYQLGGVAVITRDGYYTRFKDDATNIGVTIGNATDPSNYYSNSNHGFYSRNSAVNFATLNVTGFTVYGTLTATLASTAQTNVACYNSTSGLFTYQTAASGCAVSSARFKENITVKSNADALKVVTSLEPVKFQYKASAGMDRNWHDGFIAEQVVKVAPDLVEFDADGKTPRAVKYQEMAPYFAGAIRELKAANDNLKAEIAELKKKVK